MPINNEDPFFDYEGIRYPTILFKYRNWSDEYHKKLLLDPSVFLSPPSWFHKDDPFDCNLPVRFDLLSDIEIFEKYLESSFKENYYPNLKNHYDYAMQWFSKGILRDSLHIERFKLDYYRSYNDRFGVLSLISNPLSMSMWERYGDNGNGFVVGYRSREFLGNGFGGGGTVTYYEELPIVKPFEDHMESYLKQTYSKLSKWSFEEEYRIHKFWYNGASIEERNINISPESISEVVLGPNISDNDRNEIIGYLNNHLSHVEVKETVIEGPNVVFRNN